VIVVDAPELFATTRSLGNHDIEPYFVHEGRCRAINTQPPLESSANLDRLERSLRNLLEVAETLRERGVALRSLSEHIDTATAAGRILYAVFSSVAQFERDVLREHTVAGMRAAKSRGEHIVRPPAFTSSQIREDRKMLERGVSPSHVARALRVGRSILYRAIGHILIGALVIRGAHCAHNLRTG